MEVKQPFSINRAFCIQKRKIVCISSSLSVSGGAVSGQSKVQLHGIGLQEFTCICLYNVIKGFLGPTASEWQTPLAWRAGSLIANLLAINLGKLIHFVTDSWAVTFERTRTLISFCMCLSWETWWCYEAVYCYWTYCSIGHTNGSQTITKVQMSPLKEWIVAENLCIPLVISKPQPNTAVRACIWYSINIMVSCDCVDKYHGLSLRERKGGTFHFFFISHNTALVFPQNTRGPSLGPLC